MGLIRWTGRDMTRQQKQVRCSMTTDVMLTVMELSKLKMSAQQLAARRFPLEFLCEFANTHHSNMDQEMDDML
jgi:hypothetical protein